MVGDHVAVVAELLRLGSAGLAGGIEIGCVLRDGISPCNDEAAIIAFGNIDVIVALA